MSSSALADLKSLLRAHKLDGTLTSSLPVPQGWDENIIPTGLAPLDALLGGGLPRGHLSEVAGPRSTGRTSVLCTLLAATTARGELAALVDTLDAFDPASGGAAGIDLSRLLWIRGSPGLTLGAIARGVSERGRGLASIENSAFTGKSDLLARALNRALKALSLVLHAGGFGVVALDLADVPASAIQQVPFTTWMRLSRVIEGSKTACVLLGATPIARSSAGYTIVLQSAGAAGRWSGESDRARMFHGFDVQVRLVCARRQHVEGSCRVSVGSQ